MVSGAHVLPASKSHPTAHRSSSPETLGSPTDLYDEVLMRFDYDEKVFRSLFFCSSFLFLAVTIR